MQYKPCLHVLLLLQLAAQALGLSTIASYSDSACHHVTFKTSMYACHAARVYCFEPLAQLVNALVLYKLRQGTVKFNLVAGMLGLVYSNCKPCDERGVKITQEGSGTGTPAGNTSANPRKKAGGEVRETAEMQNGMREQERLGCTRANSPLFV
jgi:hypothetical protein